MLNSINDKLLNAKADKKWTENAEREKILEILKSDNIDKIKELRDSINYDTLQKPTNIGLQLFAKVFFWKPLNIRAIYGITKTTDLCSKFQKEAKRLSEQISGESDRCGKIWQKFGFDYEIGQENSYLAHRAIFLLRVATLFMSKKAYDEVFWDIIEMDYGNYTFFSDGYSQNTKDLKEKHSKTIDGLVNQFSIYNKYGVLNKKLTFGVFETMIPYYELLFKFDKEIANRYISTMQEKLQNKGEK